MAIIDNSLVFSDAQPITATAASTNVIDLLKPGTPAGFPAALTKDAGIGPDIPIFIEVTEGFNTLTSLTVSVETDDNAGFASPTTVLTGQAVPLASLVPGYRFRVPNEIPEGTVEQYLRLKYTVAGSNPTTGKIFAAVTGGEQTA